MKNSHPGGGGGGGGGTILKKKIGKKFGVLYGYFMLDNINWSKNKFN